MKEWTNMELKGVEEYSEGFPVELRTDTANGELCVVAFNEGGFAATWVNARQLYERLHGIFGEQ